MAAPSAWVSDRLAGMTEAQREAVLADDPVIAVVAGAGAGKTGVLTLRVARRSTDGTAVAARTLVCTFSRKAADELRHRLFRLGVHGVRSGTIHRAALGVLRDWCEHRSRPAPAVLGDRRDLLGQVCAGSMPALAVAHLDAEIAWAKARMVAPEDYESEVAAARRPLRSPAEPLARLYAAYEAERRRRSWVDLDDLLLESAAVLEEHDAFAAAQRWRYRHLLVDELQDVNPAQFRLLRAIVGADPDLFVVGDPNQSIYGWNGADPGLLDSMPRHFPDVRVIRLDDNHRCSGSIVRLAAAALGQRAESVRSTRAEGQLPVLRAHETDEAEARWVATEAWLARRPGRPWSDIAVLARTNAQLAVLARALGHQRVPYRFAGADLAPRSDLGALGPEPVVPAETDTDGASEGPLADGVVLSTFHRAKGLQWRCVFVIGLTEGLVPIGSARSGAALDEERRLLYVAMTRAEDQLWCSWAGAANPDERPRRPTRWLAEVGLARDELEREQAPAAPETVASHLAELRALVIREPATTGPVTQ